LGIVFRFLFGDEPFRILQYRTYGYLRRVCTTWRDALAATTDLCRGLEILLDGPPGHSTLTEGDGVLGFETHLAPWLAIVSRKHPYHLVLDVEDEDEFDESDDSAIDLVQRILASTLPPIPTILSVYSSKVFTLLHIWAPISNRVSRLTLSFEDAVEREEIKRYAHEDPFPCLRGLVIDAPIAFLCPINHKNLQFLSLSKICGPPQRFSEWLMRVPQLRELRLTAEDLYPPIGNGSFPSAVAAAPKTHVALEVLTLAGEDLMLLLKYLILPSLKFLALDMCGSFEDEDEIIPAFFQRLRNTGKHHELTVSLQGIPTQHTLDLIMRNLPPQTRIHYGLDGLQIHGWDDGGDDDDEMTLPPPGFCSLIPQYAHNIKDMFFTPSSTRLLWLRGDPAQSGELIKVYLPEGTLHNREIERQRRELREWGYALEVLPAEKFTKSFESSIPPMMMTWDMWA
jgi:hypothetical protein